MKKCLIFILCVCVFSHLYSENKLNDIYNINFFGFKLKYSIDEVIIELKKQNEKFKIEKSSFFANENIKYTEIIPEGVKLNENRTIADYSVVFHNNKINSILKKNLKKEEINLLLSKLESNFNVVEVEDQSNIIYVIENCILLIINYYSPPDYGEITIFSINSLREIQNIWLKEDFYKNKIYKSKIPNLPLRIKPNINGKIIFTITKNDKLSINDENPKIYKDGEFKEKYEINEEIIDEINGKWVSASVNEFIYGWVFDGYLEKCIYFKISSDSLRFRETPSSDGKIIRKFNKAEKVELIEKGKEETINGVKGNWVKVKTEKGETGWAFDGYLEEAK